MTREEAIEILKQFKKCLADVVFDEKGSEAWQMAIQALSQEMRIKKVKGLRVGYNKERDGDVVEEWRELEEKLDKALSQEQKSGKWIPVSERLPEDGKWAIFTDGKNISVERFKLDAISHFFPNGRWFELEDAIAWMPLPEPYEPQESEDEE